MAHFDLLLTHGIVVTPNGRQSTDVGVLGGRVCALGDLHTSSADTTISCRGLHVLPGVIDTQVHFREPGAEHKENLSTGTAAAIAGGVTAVFEMPNTSPLTITQAALDEKLSRAKGRAWCDYAFFVGATDDNAIALGEVEKSPGCCGVKIFMGSSTGDLLVTDIDALRAVLANGTRRISVHAEDEERLLERHALVAEGAPVSMHPEWRDVPSAVLATESILKLARETGRRVHVLHISTADEVPILAQHKDVATMEVTPQHLTLSAPECYERLGSRAQMNPPIRSGAHREALWQAIQNGVADVIGSDHAPHTTDDKAKPYPQSPGGMPGVQTLVPIMLDHVNAGRLSLERFVDLTSAGPLRVHNIAGKGRISVGYDADFTVVDLSAVRRIEDRWIRSRCAWTPYDGKTVNGWPIATIVRGRVVMRDDELIGDPTGEPVRFTETLTAAR